MNPWPVAWSAVKRSPWGALALATIIALAVALGVAVSAQERALRQGSARVADPFDVLVGAPGSATQLVLTGLYLQEAALPLLPGETFARVASSNAVAWAAPLAFGDSYRGQPILGTTADFVTLGGRRSPAEGRLFATPDEAVVGADVTVGLGAVIAPSHGHTRPDGAAAPGVVAHDDHAITVVGRLPRGGTPLDRAILVPIEGVWETHGLPTGHPEGDTRIGPPWAEPTGGMPMIVVKATSVAGAYRLRGQWRTPATMALFPAEVLVDLYATLGDVQTVVSAIALATQALVDLAILVAVMAALASRRRDVAVLRALGAPRLFVGAALWLGLAAIVTAGVVAGLALGLGAAALGSSLIGARLGFTLPVTLGTTEVAAAGLAWAVGLALALLPAGVVLRRPALDGLRA